MTPQRSQSVTLTRILDAAEARIRHNGFNGFSFRDIAADVGIRSASVHYHFPTKEDLGLQVMRRYNARFLHYLGDPKDAAQAPHHLLQRYIGGFQKILLEDKSMCLYGILGAEISALPAPVRDEVKRFGEDHVKWLKTVYRRLDPGQKKKTCKTKALCLLASLEGALMTARAAGDVKHFARITTELMRPHSLLYINKKNNKVPSTSR